MSSKTNKSREIRRENLPRLTDSQRESLDGYTAMAGVPVGATAGACGDCAGSGLDPNTGERCDACDGSGGPVSKEPRYTRGPWKAVDMPIRKLSDGEIDYGGFRIDAPDVEQLAFVWRSNIRFGSSERFGAEEAAANARLICASQDLVEALRILIACTERLPGTHSLAIDNAKAALAKATWKA